MPALALTDHNSLTAAVKFRECCLGYGILPIFGAEVTVDDGSHLTLLASSRAGYANLCCVLSAGYQIGGRLSPAVPWEQFNRFTEGVLCMTGCRRGRIARLLLQHRFDEARAVAGQLKEWYGDNLFIELQDDLTPHAFTLCQHLAMLARHIGARCVATNNVHYATPDGFVLHDIKRCAAHGVTVGAVHSERPFNRERYMKSASQMAALFDWHPDAVTNTVRIAEMCSADGIMPLAEEITPTYDAPQGQSAAQHLRYLTYEGARRRRGAITTQVSRRLDDELMLLDRLGYSSFVLHAARIVRWAREQGIMVTGRGSGADSEVCYDLGLTDVDVLQRNLPVARWVAEGKKPDIDIDFEARRRDEVFRWVAREYGPENVALCCTYATYWAKGAIRDVGKALALPADALAWFAKHVSGFTRADQIKEAFQKHVELRRHEPLAARFGLLFDLCERLSGHPRHLGSHSSGLVIGGVPLSTVNVVTPSARGVLPIIMLDKDDIEEAGAVKLDILSLPILSVVRDAERDIQRTDDGFEYDLIPREDADTYRMLWTGGNMGTFQLGSPAQAALATALHPRDFEDLVASIGLIRPGPIKSKAVKKFVAARNGYARISYLHPALEPILARTHGVCCFQEQVSYIIGAMLGMGDAEAEVWRKRLAKHARLGTMPQAREEFVGRATRLHHDLSPARAHRIMDELEGWSSLGFVEGHSASFALTGQKTAYMVRHHPGQYYAALLSNQPCGFYPPQSVLAEARGRGVEVRPLDINASNPACTTDGDGAVLRVGFRLVSGMREDDVAAIVREREAGGDFASLLDFCARLPLHRDVIESLVLCGAFDRLHPHRRGLLWRLDETVARALSMRAEASEGSQGRLDLRRAEETPVAWDIEDFSDWDRMMWEWRVCAVTTNCHPFAHLRTALAERAIITAHEAMQRRAGARVTVAGLNVRPHRSPSKAGGRHLFTTLEDESAYLQAAFYGDAADRCVGTVVLSPVVIARGIVKRQGLGVSLEVERIWPLHMGQWLSPCPAVPTEKALEPIYT